MDDSGYWHWVVDDPTIPRAEKLVALALLRHAPNIRPSVAKLVELTGYSRRWVQKLLRRLELRATLHTQRGGGRRTNSYQVDQVQLLLFSNANKISTGTRISTGQFAAAANSSSPQQRIPVRPNPKGNSVKMKREKPAVRAVENPAAAVPEKPSGSGNGNGERAGRPVGPAPVDPPAAGRVEKLRKIAGLKAMPAWKTPSEAECARRAQQQRQQLAVWIVAHQGLTVRTPP